MLNKSNAAAALEAFLAKGGTVTACAPSQGNAPSLKSMRNRAEAEATRILSGKPAREVRSSESYAEEDAEIFGAAYASGCGADAALEDLNYVRSRRR